MAKELVINIKADASNAKRALGETEQAIDGVTKHTVDADKAMQSAAESWKNGATAIAAAIAGLGIGEALQKSIGLASNIADVSQKVGISAEAVQRLGFAAK